jgi:uracil-DNA glycosylase
MAFVAEERKSKRVLPPPEDVFSAFRYTPLDKVRVVIIGQDPYFNAGEAHGLCFSVRRDVRVPPSLNRIYNVLLKQIPTFTKKPAHGCLERWALQGVFLLNATLTVVQGTPNSHAKCGWQQFTDAVIRVLNERCKGLVYMLWGGFACKKGSIIDRANNSVLEGPHPSPMSGEKWNSTRHFAEANKILTAAGLSPIDWRVD